MSGTDARSLGPLGGTLAIVPLVSAWEGAGGLLSVGLRVETAFRDRVVIGVSGRWAASTQWAALQFGEVHWAGPEARLGMRQRIGRGRFAARADLYGGALWIGGLQGAIEQDSVDLTAVPPRVAPLIGVQLGVGAAAPDVGWVPTDPGLVASVVLQWPGVVSVF